MTQLLPGSIYSPRDATYIQFTLSACGWNFFHRTGKLSWNDWILTHTTDTDLVVELTMFQPGILFTMDGAPWICNVIGSINVEEAGLNFIYNVYSGYWRRYRSDRFFYNGYEVQKRVIGT